jgi:hypothetical protein
MSEYLIGKDIGMLLARVEALEAAVKAKPCVCEEKEGRHGVVRVLTKEEGETFKRAPPQWCTYSCLGACPPLGINFMDDICVTPCPPCPDVIALRVINAQGAEICTFRVKWNGAGHCTECPPGGHQFHWA